MRTLDDEEAAQVLESRFITRRLFNNQIFFRKYEVHTGNGPGRQDPFHGC